jgi:hypothetical protein
LKEYENLSTSLPNIDFDTVRCIMKLYEDLQKISMFFKKYKKEREKL